MTAGRRRQGRPVGHNRASMAPVRDRALVLASSAGTGTRCDPGMRKQDAPKMKHFLPQAINFYTLSEALTLISLLQPLPRHDNSRLADNSTSTLNLNSTASDIRGYPLSFPLPVFVSKQAPFTSRQLNVVSSTRVLPVWLQRQNNNKANGLNAFLFQRMGFHGPGRTHQLSRSVEKRGP